MVATSKYDAISLWRLPAPDVVETIDYEDIVQTLRDDLVARFPAIVGVIDLESEPARKLLEAFAYREVILRSRVNDAARAVMLAYASGNDLDAIGANYNVERQEVIAATNNTPAVMEDDERFRRRIQLKIEAFSVAGPSGAYVYHALTADPTLRDATAISPAPGSVRVTIMNDGDNPVPTDAQVAAVLAALNAEDCRPLTDNVQVVKVSVIDVNVEAELTLYPGPDAALVQAEAVEAVQKLVDESERLGYDLKRSALFGRLHVEGVQSVNLISPAADVAAGDGEFVKVGTVSVTVAGRDV